MASKRLMRRRRTRHRTQTRWRRRTVRRRRTRPARRFRRQKTSTRTSSKLPKKVQKNKVRMTRDAWSMLHTYVDGIYKKVSGEAERLRRRERRPSIISSDVQAALSQVMPRKYHRRAAYSKTR